MGRVPAQPPVIRLRLEDSSGLPLRNVVYRFAWREVSAGHTASQTDDNGVLVEPIPPGGKTADLTLTDPVWAVVVRLTSYGDPPAGDGMAARLSNLGLMAFGPTVEPSAVDPGDVARAVSRYRELKAQPSTATLDQIGSLLAQDHDNL